MRITTIAKHSIGLIALCAATALGFHSIRGFPQDSGTSLDIQTQDGSPVSFEKAECSPNGPADVAGSPEVVCQVSLRNAGSKDIIALAIKAVSTKSDGTRIQSNTSFMNASFPIPGMRGAIAPLQEIRFDRIILPSLTRHVQLSVDFVEYDDNTSWVDSHSPDLWRIRGMRVGAQQLIDFLRDAKRAEGADAALRKIGLN